MSETNGTNGTKAGEFPPFAIQATEIILKNGLKVWCYPIPQRDRRKLVLQWMEQNPLPDRKEYERLVPEDEATIPGQTLSAESNPDWKEMLLSRQSALNDYLVHSFLVGYTEFPEDNEAELIARYARLLARKRKVLKLPDDPWEATLRGAIVDNVEDEAKLIRAIEQQTEVTYEEVVEHVAIFRPVHRGNTNREVSTEPDPQSAAAQSGLQQD